ncbi:LPP20 family lipoprotein [Hydrogenimonas sp.]
MKRWILFAAIVPALALMAENCPKTKVEYSGTAVVSDCPPANDTKAVNLRSEKNDVVTLSTANEIHFQVVGQGVAPVNTISPAQARALAKRAAIADAYRQLGEKIAGVRVEGRDLIRNMMISRSTVRTQIDAMIRNARILDTKFKDGLCEVEMEVTVNGNEWYPKLVN